MRCIAVAAVAVAALTLGLAAPALAQQGGLPEKIKQIKLPPGFEISIYARAKDARSMAISKPLEAVWVGTRHDNLYAVLDRDSDYVADEVITRANNLNVPNGVTFHPAGMLYVVEHQKVSRLFAVEFDFEMPYAPETVYEGMPEPFLHGWRYAKFGPDGKLYIGVGAPCNICDTKGMEGSIIRMNADGSNVEVYAQGVRNSVGFDWHPKTGEMFFTDNGADGLGDNRPPDELNHAPKKGMHFGYPFFAGGDVRSPGYEDKKPPQEPTMPVVTFAAHSANLGVHFYEGDMFPREYKNDAFVAQHGSWNRSTPIGYRIMRIKFDDKGMPTGKEVFASGWLQGDSAWGRPVDIVELSDGSLLVSDDFSGTIYRISYNR